MSTASPCADFCFEVFKSIKFFLGILPYLSYREDHKYLPILYRSVFREVFHASPFLSLNFIY